MIINKYNIEKWMFDYFEGNLTVHEKIEFERFLEANPYLENDLELWEDSYSSSTEYPVFEVPQGLIKKSILSNKSAIVSLILLTFFISGVGTYLYLNQEDTIVEKSNLTYFETKESSKEEVKESVKVDYNHAELIDAKYNKAVLKQLNSNLDNLENKENLITPRFKNEIDLTVESHKVELKDRNQNSLVKEMFDVNEKLDQKKNYSSIKVNSNKMISILVPEANNKIIKYTEKTSKKKSKYNYLNFKRSHKKKKRKEFDSKNKKSKEREKEFWDNIALIGNVFYTKDEKSKKVKGSKFLNKFKNKELALTNTHDPIFVKDNSNPVENNLALVGGLGMARIKANVSNRWRSSINEKNSGLITFDTYLEKLNAGVGVNVSSSQMPSLNLNTSTIGVTYSQRIQLKENSSFNIGVKYGFNRTESNSINIDNDMPIEFDQNKLMSFSNTLNHNFKGNSHNFSSAIWYDGRFLYGGINLDNIKSIKKQNNNANEFAEYINPFKFAIQLGTDYRRNVYSALIISPQVNYSYELSNSNLWLGSSLKYKRFVTGVGVSLSNAYKVNMGIQGDKIRFIYAFDYSKSKAESKFYGTHEVSFRYLLRSKNNWNK